MKSVFDGLNPSVSLRLMFAARGALAYRNIVGTDLDEVLQTS